MRKRSSLLFAFVLSAGSHAQAPTGGGGSTQIGISLESQSATIKCVANGVTDCLPAFNVLKAAYLYRATNPPSGVKIVLGPGAYYFSASPDMSTAHGMTIEGAGNLSTTVTVGSGNYAAFKAIGTYASPIGGIAIRNLAIICGGKAKSAAHGVQWSYVNSGTIENVRFLGCNHAMDLTGQWQTRLTNNIVFGGGAQQTAVCLYMGFPTDVADVYGNNAVIASRNLCQGAVAFGARLIDANGSIFDHNQWIATGIGVYACDQPSATYPSGSTAVCEFMFFDQDQTDTTTSYGWKFKLGSGGSMGPGIVVQQPWIGSSGTATIDIEGGSFIQVTDAAIVTADIGINLLNVTNSRISGTISEYNKRNNGSQSVSLSGRTSGNEINVMTSTSNPISGSYNGIVEAGTYSNNRLYAGPATCMLGIAFGGATSGLTYGTQSCTYEVLGLDVSVQFYTALSTVGSSTGAATLTGLPIPASAISGGSGYGGVSALIANNMSGLSGPVLAEAVTGATTVNLYNQLPTGSFALQNTNFTNLSVITGRLQYRKP